MAWPSRRWGSGCRCGRPSPGKASGLGRNVKQSGGHGEYAICHIELEPLPSGSGLEFVDKIVGGVVPRQFIPSVEKGVRAQMEQGVIAGYPMVDIKVTLYDGKAHSVDSSDMAFQKAGRAALRDAADKAQPQLLEPVDEVSVLIGDDYVGAVMSDMSSRRGRVLGTEPVPGGRTLVKAEVPELELIRYAIDLRSISQGTGSFTRSYLRYEPLPSHLKDKVMAEAKAGLDHAGPAAGCTGGRRARPASYAAFHGGQRSTRAGPAVWRGHARRLPPALDAAPDGLHQGREQAGRARAR